MSLLFGQLEFHWALSCMLHSIVRLQHSKPSTMNINSLLDRYWAEAKFYWTVIGLKSGKPCRLQFDAGRKKKRYSQRSWWTGIEKFEMVGEEVGKE